ncbi:MAG: hypothetical protein IJT25_03340, partial [Clostridia bacterium]|nr:hypothetical protein [Clostridia bacterium]
MKNIIFSLGEKLSGFLANGNTIDGNITNNKFIDVFFGGILSFLEPIGNWLMTLVYFIVKFALNIIDLLQYFIERLIGLDVWNSSSSTLADLTNNDIIFKFLLNEEVLRVFRALVVIGIILLIIFSIVAIVRTEYNNAIGESSNKKAILVSALKAIFLAVLVPLMTIFGILASNAVLASILNAIRPDGNNLTMGGQIFVASAYNANRFRIYADEDERRVATYNYTFAYNVYSGEEYDYYIPVGAEKDADEVFVISKLQSDKFRNGDNLDIVKLSSLPTTIDGAVVTSEIKSDTKFHTFCSVFEAINPSDFGAGNPL